MKITMLIPMQGVRLSMLKGEDYEVADDEGVRLCEANFAKPADSASEKVLSTARAEADKKAEDEAKAAEAEAKKKAEAEAKAAETEAKKKAAAETKAAAAKKGS